MPFDQIISINNIPLTKKYIESLSKQERLDLIDPIFNYLRTSPFIFPDDSSKFKKEYQKLVEFAPPVDQNFIFNNSSACTDICKFFCKSFYYTTERNKPTIIELFNNDSILKKIIHNRLGLDWIDDNDKGPGVNESFNLSFKMIIQGMRSMRLVSQISMFKPTVAKWITEKYSNPNDTIYDYSAGFGGRMLGTLSANRNYIAADPLTIPELIQMKDFLNLSPTLFHSGSEFVRLDKHSIDLSFSSPPYYDQEYYSTDPSQAYNKGEDYFYNTYWRNTLDNIKYMLKPNKFFILNVSNQPKMVEIAKEYFSYDHEIQLQTVRSHLTKSKGTLKYEPVYVFKNSL